ncbi:ATP-dependent helicase [Nesterenkonia natronophila]|uniref:DNA 3'-5' helicase n=1 Tax=Nesterenkonia natronophila TaxID=2174932 RepID=A0A3A4F5N6_9MICC|nr:ATP-dependent helicase [Nesterenkonia natronophila]RJN31770.1 ATP-dependent helicase [Nesterenkonia natronophila]
MTVQEKALKFTPAQIAEALGEFTPTPEQCAVIESGLEPMLVVAGAGSGKTATMADRVVYLVANGFVTPPEILGVTFTRKAAGELAERVTDKLKKLVEKELIRAEDLIPPDLRIVAYGNAEHPEIDLSSVVEPTISTYHSYAHSLVSEYGLHMGLEPESELVGGAQSWQIITRLITEYQDGAALIRAEANASSLPEQVLKLSQDMAEHLKTPPEVISWLDTEITRAEEWEHHLSQKGQDLLNTLRLRRETAKLAAEYQVAKQSEAFMDHGDLLRYAAQLAAAEDSPVRTREREKYKVILLDEFQDTSHAQLKLFADLFGRGTGHAVTAVGDPNQSIYGFRGASAGQLFQFPQTFPAVDSQTGRTRPADLKQLTIAWRNGRSILDVANKMVKPFTLYTETTGPRWHRGTGRLRRQLTELITADRMDTQGRVLTPEGTPLAEGPADPAERAQPIAPAKSVADGHVSYGFFATEDEETAAIVEEMRSALDVAEGAESPECAVLATTHGHLGKIADALRRSEIPYELAGLSGLLYRPEIVELLAYLRVLSDPKRSDELIRILGGARFRIGPGDLYLLGRRASGRARQRNGSFIPHDEDTQSSLEPELDEMPSLVEALDHFDLDPTADETSRRGFSAEGIERITRARDQFRTLRELLHLDLGSLIQRIINETGLGVEVSARPWEVGNHPTRQLDMLIEYAESFAASSTSQDLTGFLDWLSAAVHQERALEQAPADPQPGAVQLLTVHASKGLEWDVVAVAGLRRDRFPRLPRMATNWTKKDGDLPWPLRGDADSLPQWISDQREDTDKRTAQVWARSAGATSSLKDYEGPVYKDDCVEFSEEEDRRLAYVAMTRAKTRLLCTGACFYGASGGQEPSPFLLNVRELAQEASNTGHFQELAWYDHDPEQQNPLANITLSATWPYDPLEELPVRQQLLIKADLQDPTSIDTYEDVDPGAAAPPRLTRRPAMEQAADLVTRQLRESTDLTADELNPWLEQARLVIQRAEQRRSSARSLELPKQLSASSVVQLKHDRTQVLEQARRPIPQRPSSAARRGTAIHAIIEQVLEVQASLPDIDELFANYNLDDVDGILELERVRASYQNSPWAAQPAFAVEIPLETTLAGTTLRGRIDAVFARDAQGTALSHHIYETWTALPRAERDRKMAACTFDLVDWKTGDVPRGPDLEEKELQLAVYKIAFSRLYGVPMDNIRAHFAYLDQGIIHSPKQLAEAGEVESLIREK